MLDGLRITAASAGAPGCLQVTLGRVAHATSWVMEFMSNIAKRLITFENLVYSILPIRSPHQDSWVVRLQ
jgi:hypothetical protein